MLQMDSSHTFLNSAAIAREALVGQQTQGTRTRLPPGSTKPQLVSRWSWPWLGMRRNILDLIQSFMMEVYSIRVEGSTLVMRECSEAREEPSVCGGLNLGPYVSRQALD